MQIPPHCFDTMKNLVPVFLSKYSADTAKLELSSAFCVSRIVPQFWCLIGITQCATVFPVREAKKVKNLLVYGRSVSRLAPTELKNLNSKRSFVRDRECSNDGIPITARTASCILGHRERRAFSPKTVCATERQSAS